MKILYIILGCTALLLGGIGAVIPLLPSFPFLLISAFCFAKSSKKLYKWFVSTKLYKNNLESFINRKEMTLKSKIRIITAVTLIMVIGFLIMENIPIGRLILAVIWILHLLYFSFKVKTI